MYYSTGMHNSETHIRVTVTFPEYADTSKTIAIKNIGIISSYSSAATNRDAFVQDFYRNATGYGHVYIPSGHSYMINSNACLSETGLGSTVVNSSLTSVGTLSSLTVSGDATFDTSTLKVDSSNNRVGIGTTSPSTTLHLGSSSATATKILVEASDTDTGYDGLEIKRKYPRIKLNDTDGTDNSMYMWHLGNQLRFGSNAGSASDASFVIKNGDAADSFFNGNVGIGIASPTTTLDVEGTVSYKHISLTDSSDDLDVSGCTVVECTPSGTDTLGGLTGGVQGQILYILKVDSGLGRIIIEHAEGTGNQDIRTISGSDVMLSARAGLTLYCTGSEWIQVG
jgi:hypothetical protein